MTIMSDQDPRFTPTFWRRLQKMLGTRFDFSSSFHPQINDQIERLNQTLEDMLRVCVLNFIGS